MEDESLPFGDMIRSGGVDAILSALYRRILQDINLDSVSTFENLLAKYVLKNYKNTTSIKEQSALRAAMRKELLKNKMTFKVFVKGLRVLNVRRFKITIELEHANRKTTVHTLPVINSHDTETDESQDPSNE